MRTHRLATLAAASTVALLALGGTAFALGADDTPPPAATNTATAAPTTTTASSSVGRAHAAAIAVQHVGGGQVTKVEREVEHGRVEWKVDVLRGTVAHEVRVDDATGVVVRADSGPVSRSTAPRSTAPAPAVRSDDGPLHDVGDDHGGASGKGTDDGAAHDAGDDHGRHGGGDDHSRHGGGDNHGRHGGDDD